MALIRKIKIKTTHHAQIHWNINYLFNFTIGEEFNFCAILDDYELGRTLGEGGFGKVVLGKHREKKNEVAIKFTDVGD